MCLRDRLGGQGGAMEIILTGRKVPAEEALRIGMCEQLVPHGEARQAAEAMAREIARFPQAAVRADRRTVHESHGLPLRDAMRAKIAEITGLPQSTIAVKATTSERLGFTGRQEGIAATAAATVRLPWDETLTAGPSA